MLKHMFTLGCRKSEFIKISLNETGEVPTDDTYVNIYCNEDSIIIYTLDNDGNSFELTGEVEQ